ncbi:MAG: homoserine dehydrogenase [Candidatus Altiarchaeales archaeon]|nr:homoserine dehydrogenase [Candidatus Altiarchaeales archaeon]
MKEVKLIIVGFGNIGRRFAEVLEAKKGFISRKYGLGFSVVAIAEKNGSLVNEKGLDLKKALKVQLARNPCWTGRKSLDVIKSVEADIMLELTPGDIRSGEPGLSHIMRALEAGKDVVTSNKSPIALKFREIMEYARKKGCEVRYEATVGGAIPIINLYRNTLQVNEVRNVYGILNGTTNFILSKMSEESVDFDIALKEAQELGLAESDASYDVDGVDTAVKLVILANSLMGRNISFKDVKVSGIREVNSETLDLAKKHGSEIRLIGDVAAMEVSPRLIPKNHPLNISGALNAVLIETDVAGDIILVGVGAGPRETSSSLMSDVLDLGVRKR